MKLAVYLFAATMVLGGCATQPNPIGTYIPGRMVSLVDGKIIPLQVQLSYGSGQMNGTDPATGETFTGTYTAIQETSTNQVSTPSFWGDQDTAQEVKTSDVAQASAVLVGNKGTVFNIKMTVKAGNPPIGFGEATDNAGKKYNVQF
jgi:hypothetical protein